ncbi:MAG TPA: hypothetical protein VHL52_10080 [Acidimicrobiia bacterium]|nr:hypothetical protein [Acidimicrobiia bacterium]
MTAATATSSVGRSLSIDWRRTLRVALLTGGVTIFLAAIGMVQAFNQRTLVEPIIKFGYLVVAAVPFTAGYLIARRLQVTGAETPRTVGDVVSAAIAGAIAGAMTGAFVAFVQAVPNIREIFPNLGPQLVETLTYSLGTGGGFVANLVLGMVLAVCGAAVHWLSRPIQRALVIGAEAVVIFALFETVIDDFFDWFKTLPNTIYANSGGLTILWAVILFTVAVGLSLYLPGRIPSVRKAVTSGDERDRRRKQIILIAVVSVALIIVPQLLGGVLNELLTNVGLFVLMGLGLNIVVGLAGLLDLGYVAFFAIGAYTTAVLTSPLSPFFNPELSWWLAFPVVLVMAIIAGIMVGTPVIRMRGDYLAIVTLGFGEIVRLTLLSDWLSPYFGGAQGIRNIPGIPVGEISVSGVTPELMVYAAIALVAVAVYVSWRVQDSRIGRAWAAMREDEDVAEAVGIDTVKAKLLAFVTGAVLASFAGALFAAKLGSVFTASFEILTSIIILVVVIVGGMGNIAGVAVGALVLIGVLGGPSSPGLLQEFGQFKLLIYGALLVFMMLKRPEGLIPSARRAQELHQEEFLQDAWLDKGDSLATSETEGKES